MSSGHPSPAKSRGLHRKSSSSPTPTLLPSPHIRLVLNSHAPSHHWWHLTPPHPQSRSIQFGNLRSTSKTLSVISLNVFSGTTSTPVHVHSGRQDKWPCLAADETLSHSNCRRFFSPWSAIVPWLIQWHHHQDSFHLHALLNVHPPESSWSVSVYAPFHSPLVIRVCNFRCTV